MFLSGIAYIDYAKNLNDRNSCSDSQAEIHKASNTQCVQKKTSHGSSSALQW